MIELLKSNTNTNKSLLIVFFFSPLETFSLDTVETKMRAKKPQTRLAGGPLTKSLKSNAKKTTKPNTATKARPINNSSVKSVASKKLTVKNTTSNVNAKAKDESENNEKKSKSINRNESNTAVDKVSSMGSNSSKEKPINRNKAKAEKKSAATAINGEKKAATVKDEKIIKPSKELKNLDIQICGYSSVAAARESTGSDSDTDRIIKASICEIVKTKARAASATFNSSGNRSPSVNSPGPNNVKSNANTSHEKSNKTETALKSPENKTDDKPKKKKEPAKAKSTVKPKTMKTVEDGEKSKKNSNENKNNKKSEGDKNTNKSQKAKTKATDGAAKVAETPAISTEKRIEIKTQVTESKSLIDTITEAINEVVKQYKDSNKTESDATGSNSNSTKAAKAKANKIVKTTKKKVLNDKKLEVIGSATDLLNETKGAMSAISKKAKSKPKIVKDNKKDDTADDQKISSEKIAAKEAAAADIKVSNIANEEAPKKANDKTNKSATKSSKVRPKAGKKPTAPEQPEAKGSKIIKIDLKAKKKVKSLATVKSASLKSATKQLQSKINKESKLCQDDGKKNDEHKSHANAEEMSDDDNLSLTELKAQLSKSDTKKTDSEMKNSNASTKLVNIVSNPANKQKTTKSSGSSSGAQKPSVSKTAATPPKKKVTSHKEMATTTNTTNRSNVYDFPDANFGSSSVGVNDVDEIPYVHKKKREKILSSGTPGQENTDKHIDTKKPNEKSKTLPPKKQIRLDTVNEIAKLTKNESKSTANSAKSNVKANNRNVAENKGEKDKNTKTIDETKKTAKASANKSHKLIAKNRRMKLFGFYSGPKRHRMASLNATAKVQCLYENESRTAQELGFVKEPQHVQRMKFVTDSDKTDTHSAKNHAKEKEIAPETDGKKEKKSKKDGDIASAEVERDDNAGNNRTLRKVPGMRGEGSMWEMENSSLDESEYEKETKTVSNKFSKYKQ